MRSEVERLCEVGVLRKVNRSGGQHLPIIKKKNGSARFISDFRELNKRISRKPISYPEDPRDATEPRRFAYATSIDLNMGYYHIELSPGPALYDCTALGQVRIPETSDGLM
jgi:hypothetical protein